MTLCNDSSGLYAKWDDVEQAFLDAIEGELTRTDPMEPQPSEADYKWAQGIARRATGTALNHLDGYGIEDLKDALLSDDVAVAVRDELIRLSEASDDEIAAVLDREDWQTGMARQLVATAIHAALPGEQP